ncbi:MAG TPA: protein kinase [Thermoanaerobaculia bacterium]|nr:protein kinase [Thermoanaerobaculia bacterium]
MADLEARPPGGDPDAARTIGPYQLRGELGSGGMGTVYRAYDSRLERWVAVKRIHAEAAAEDKARERFRREAKAAARLRHPSVVQVYDLIEDEEGLALVMELVDGVPLSIWRRAGERSLPQRLAVGRQVAEALAAAHDAGIVHRDLKAENVLITAEGQARVLDFGLAKLLGERPLGEPALTAAHTVVGTLRSMAPEQAVGGDVDERADLFSLGVLLYELATGESPFEGADAVETLTRVCSHRQPPAVELAPELSGEVSLLIDRLLEKDRNRRPGNSHEAVAVLSAALGGEVSVHSLARSAATFGQATQVEVPMAISSGLPRPRRRLGRRGWMALTTLGVVGAGLAGWLLRPQPELHVVVPEVEVVAEPPDPRLALLTASVRSGVVRGLTALTGVVPVVLEGPDAPSGPSSTVAAAEAADELVRSRLDCAGGVCRATLMRVRGGDGGLLWTRSFEVPTDDLFAATSAAEAQLRQAYRERGMRPGASLRLDVDGADYQSFLAIRSRFYGDRRRAPLAELARELEAVRASSPRFLDAHLLAADLARFRYAESLAEGDLATATAAVAEARRLAPEDPAPLFTAVDVALAGGRLAEAEAALAELGRREPGDSRLLAQRALLVERMGQPGESLTLMRRAAERHPSWRNLYQLANLEIRQGETSAAREHLLALLERFPASHLGRTLLAQLELLNGSPERAAELYEALVEEAPGVVPLSNLGLAHFLLGRYAEAAASFEKVTQLEPGNPIYLLNLADATFLLGRTDAAHSFYEQVLAFAPATTGDWQQLTVRAQALAHLGRTAEAIATIQEGLKVAGQNPQAYYEASLVYTLAGELGSASVNASLALKGGVERRWFSFPWFAPLRNRPELAGRI